MRSADSALRRADSLGTALARAAGPADSIVVLLGLTEALRGESVGLRLAVASLQVEADSVLVLVLPNRVRDFVALTEVKLPSAVKDANKRPVVGSTIWISSPTIPICLASLSALVP